jgi:hypothetical protein
MVEGKRVEEKGMKFKRRQLYEKKRGENENLFLKNHRDPRVFAIHVLKKEKKPNTIMGEGNVLKRRE